jgi:WD40 repeat protein
MVVSVDREFWIRIDAHHLHIQKEFLLRLKLSTWATLALLLIVLLPVNDSKAANGLSSSGPWLAYTRIVDPQLEMNPTQLWIANSDGSGKTLIGEGKIFQQLAASPSGHRLAYITATTDKTVPYSPYRDINLNILTLPDTKSPIIIPLVSEAGYQAMANQRYEPAEAIMFSEYSIAWSPDGQTLAFIAATGGPSADLYVYSVTTGEVTQLSDGPSQAFNPSWSPDGRYILHFGADGFGTGAGMVLAGVWVADTQANTIKTLYKPEGGGEGSLGWVDNITFLASSWYIVCGQRNLREVNIETGQQIVWFNYYFQNAAYSPENHILLVSVPDFGMECMPGQPQPGLYRISGPGAEPERIGDPVSHIEWSPVTKSFFVTSVENGQAPLKVFSVTPDGKFSERLNGLIYVPQFSPDGNAWVTCFQGPCSIATAPNFNPITFESHLREMTWIP